MIRPSLFLLAAAGACTATDEGRDGRATGVASQGDAIIEESPLALVPSTGGMGHQAALSGRLILDGGCLYVERPNGERLIPVFRSPNTRWNAETGTVETVSSGRFRVGDLVRLPGGLSSPQSWSKPPPGGCAGDRFWVVTQPMVLRPGGSASAAANERA